MRQVLYTFLFATLASATLVAQTTTQPLVVKRTATWCPLCSSWGWDSMKALVSEVHGSQASVIALHHSGDLADDLNKELAQNFPALGQPIFMSNGTDLNFTSTTWETKLQDYKSDLTTINEMESGVRFDNILSLLYEGTYHALSAQVSLSSINLPEGNYRLGVYLVSDNVIAQQVGLGEVHHPKIVTRKLTDHTFGVPIFENGETTFESVIQLDIDPSFVGEFVANDNEGEEFLYVIWRLNENSGYDVVTTYTQNLLQVPVSVEDYLLDTELSVHQTVSGDLMVSTSDLQDQAMISLLDTSGKLIYSAASHTDNTIIPSQSIQVNPGLYIVRVSTQEGYISQKIFLR